MFLSWIVLDLLAVLVFPFTGFSNCNAETLVPLQ